MWSPTKEPRFPRIQELELSPGKKRKGSTVEPRLSGLTGTKGKPDNPDI